MACDNDVHIKACRSTPTTSYLVSYILLPLAILSVQCSQKTTHIQYAPSHYTTAVIPCGSVPSHGQSVGKNHGYLETTSWVEL